ncbi:4-hydroxy-tetrahydrodipicolinate synthase [Colwelliaceae bacterium BS250]
MTSVQYNINNYPLWTALVTPFDQFGEVDYNCLAKLVDDQQQAGNAILLLGSTGEGLAIELAEQKKIVKFVCDLNPIVPLMVAVGGANLKAQTAWVEECNDLPIHAYLLGTPMYAKPEVVGQTQWFNQLLNAAKHPCMIYNVPGRSAISIPTETVANISEHKNLWAMKEASGDIDAFMAYKKAAPKMRMYTGEDPLIPILAAAGAVGLVSVCANAWPEATNLYVEKSLRGDTNGLMSVWYDATNALFEQSNPIPVKVLMHKQSVLNTPVLRAPLTHLELISDQGILAADQAITEWLCQNRTHLRAVK